jgi:hypothetical protein
MGNLDVNRNVFQTVTQAIKDKNVTAEEMQTIRTEMEASGRIDATEQAVLQNLESGTAFTLRSGSASASIDPKQLSFPVARSASALQGQTIGTTAGTFGDFTVKLGQPIGTYRTERDAVIAARAQYGIGDDPDVAIVQNANGKYQLHKLEMPGWVTRDDADFRSYGQIRSAQLQSSLPQGAKLIAVVSEDNDVRFFARESSPRTYGRPDYPPAMTPAQGTSAADRQARVTQLRASASQALERLKQMEQDLGGQKDHRGIFSTMYRVITEKAIKEMDRFTAQGDLRAAEFEGSLLVNFANRYFDAYDNYSQGNLQAVPEVWRSAFDAGRNAEAAGYNKTSMTEVVGLSMVAHIINDLPQTLKDIGYTNASDRQSHLQGVYDSFNGALMEEKGNIMGALGKQYGTTDIHMLDALGSVVLGGGAAVLTTPILAPIIGPRANNAIQGEVFTLMRTMARDRALSMTPAEIKARALNLSDNLRVITPGGN